MPAQGAAFLPAPVAVARPRLRGVGATQASSFVCAPGARRAALVPPPPARHARRVRRAVPSAALPALPVLASSLAAGIAASAAKFAPIGVSVVLLGSVVVWHEYGHLRAAQLQGIRVKNFSIGFGPTLFSFEGKNGTVYTLRLLPLGGFVSFPENKLVNEETGELTGELDSDPDLLQNRPILDRAIVISAGVVANVVMAWGALFLSSALVGQAVYNVSPGVVISSIVDANGAGAKSNLLPGDVVLAVDGVAVPSTLESATVVAGKIRRSGGHPMDFRLARGGKELNKSVRANYVPSTGESALGVQLIPNAAVTRQRPTSVPMAIRRTNEDFVRLSAQTWNGLKSLFTNFRESSSNLSGPIGVVATGASLASTERASLLTFVAVISINVALLNSIPLIPALDGGQMAFLLIELLRGGKAVPARVQEAANSAAFLLIIGLSGLIFLNDIEKLSLVSTVTRTLFG